MGEDTTQYPAIVHEWEAGKGIWCSAASAGTRYRLVLWQRPQPLEVRGTGYTRLALERCRRADRMGVPVWEEVQDEDALATASELYSKVR